MKNSGELSSHDRILRAAKRLFAQNGYENTSTVAIARDAGTSESQLMKHFGSKQGLLVAILERGWTNVGQRCSTINNASPGDRLLAVLKAITIEFENDPEFKVLAALEARRVRKDSNEIVLTHGWRQYRELIDRILSDMRAEGQVRADVNLSAVRSAIVGMAEGMWRDQVVADRSGMRPEYGFDDVQSVLEVLVLGLQEPVVQQARAS
jgi:AcrR family transcriptional regulator